MILCDASAPHLKSFAIHSKSFPEIADNEGETSRPNTLASNQTPTPHTHTHSSRPSTYTVHTAKQIATTKAKNTIEPAAGAAVGSELASRDLRIEQLTLQLDKARHA